MYILEYNKNPYKYRIEFETFEGDVLYLCGIPITGIFTDFWVEDFNGNFLFSYPAHTLLNMYANKYGIDYLDPAGFHEFVISILEHI